MLPPWPSPVAEWHNETYDAINPSNKELSMAGKTIVITGGGTGIGRETVLTFAIAGAKTIHILGRTQSSLSETKAIVEKEIPGTRIVLHVADVTDLASVEKAAKEVGSWDVLVSNAGYLPKSKTLKELDLADWWQGFEINVKGNLIVTKAFLPQRNANSSLVGVSSAVVSMPAAMLEGGSSYVTSKLATIKFFEFVAAEYPDVHVVTLHPGVVDTAMNKKSGIDNMPMDDVKLPAHFILWAASAEAAFARGRFIWCNWNVTQLKALKRVEEEPLFMTSGVLGWPWA
ncbi:NAD(P)-binding protein [Mytilinidion resinicola]|uniref:NAD(P)-binding protein n=1 Tax=Mytilinidion resinicola TaxID=574789 RepID=A0A6A6YT02_9PEZI|nr:NAD(P)-binding protein [Mytilinidion resinicola]KAF2811649.1 NAD(P)-binding protein [Mytilinidion resinicola]